MSIQAPRPAASVILCRNPADLEVYWVRRRESLAFLGGFHSFPGGGLSAADEAAAKGISEAPGDARLRLCALRELDEETGVRLTAKDMASLVPAGRWITPPFSPRRFDTTFYLAWCPPGVRPHVDSGELAHGEWIRPEAALDLWSDGKVLLAPPTLYALRGLYASALMASGEGVPLDLAEAAPYLTGAPESEGGEVTRIEMRPGFFLFPLKTRTMPPATHTNAFLVGGSDMVLVDPGSSDPREISRLLGFIEQLGGEGKGVREIWLTHHHPDHVGGTREIGRKLGVPLRAHPETAGRLSGEGLRVEPVLTEGCVREMPGRPGWRLRVLHTPGHARGHVAILEEVSGTLIAGDMVAGVGFVVIDPPEGNMKDYLESLERLKGLGASALFPSHGPPTAGVAEKLQEYIAHRLEREAKVLACLSREESRSLSDLLPVVYDDVDPAMWPLAERSLLAHLEKLVGDGRVVVVRDVYRLL